MNLRSIAMLLALACFIPVASLAQGEVYQAGSEKQLFIDELLIATKSNVALKMNAPVKTLERNVVPEHP